MRFGSIKLRGIGPFREEVSLDISALQGPLVAVCGDVGAGKSTLLECLAGAAYRRCPTRGSLSDLATSRDAFVEVKLVNGAEWTIRQTVDCITGKGESLVLDANGAPAMSDGKLRTFDEWSKKTLPSEAVLYSGPFAVQGRGGFLALPATEQQAIVLKLLGVEEIRRIAGLARERARDAKAAVDVARARLQDANALGYSVDVCEARLLEAVAVMEAAERDAVVTSTRLRAAEAEAERVRALIQADNERRRLAGELQARLAASRAQVVDLDGRIRNNAGVLERAEEIRTVVETVEAIDAELAEMAERVAVLSSQAHTIERERAAALTRISQCETRWNQARARVNAADERLAQRAIVDEAARYAEQLRLELQASEPIVALHEAALAELQSRRVAGAEDRIGNLRGALGHIQVSAAIASESDYPDQAKAILAISAKAGTALKSDDQIVMDATDLPAAIDSNQRQLAAARKNVSALRAQLQSAEKTAAMASAVEAAAKEREAAMADVAAGVAEHERERLAIAAVDAANASVVSALAALGSGRGILQTKRLALWPIAALADRLTTAEARLAELEPQRVAAEVAVITATEELATLEQGVPRGTQLPAMPDVDAARAADAESSRALVYARVRVETATKELAGAHERAARLDSLTAELNELDLHLSDWQRLADDLGAKGLQALVIDAAGPELTELTNDLLHHAFGSRFSVRLDTLRSSSDGKRELEVFDIRVIDTERGRDAYAESLSGGEKVIVGEALSLALSTLACRAAGVGVTLIRDESGAALDAETGRRYVHMLRRAAELVQADKVIFVSHNAEMQAMADTRVLVHNGRIEVQS